MSPTLPTHVKLVEVGPRDGLQNEGALIPTADKIRFIQALGKAGLTHIEATSFVHPKAVPQMADALEVLASLDLSSNSPITYSALVPNLKGLERAIDSGVKRIAVFTATSNSFTQKNIGMTVAESLTTFETVVQQALAAGLSVRGYVSTAWVCPYEGQMPAESVRDVTEALFNMGVDEVSLGDTIGAATPVQIQHTLSVLLNKHPNYLSALALHCHDTYGTALANVMAGLQMGISTFDASAGGLGGCPYAPGASGNVATEDVVSLMDRLGINTGVDVTRVVEATALMETLLGRPLTSKTYQRLRTVKTESCV
ncbi:MAG: hydroxymethylglutaryl-CoA lyase [Vampirovibrionales bacterium]|nr:hydroxymethylglutaryl-CoA lyase [Vampirovibrionales bacterium]